jgi:hypothetical protein
MDILKTPHQKLLEEAGAIPPTPGMAHTPQQMLMQESGIMPHYAQGGSVQDMLAELVQQGHLPQHFAAGGSTLKNIGTQAAFSLPFIGEDAQSIAKAIKQKQYPEAAAQTAGVGYSAFAPFNPLTALLSGMTYSPEVGDATLDAYLAQREAEAAPKPQPKQKRPAERHNIIPFTETRFYKN